MSVDYSQKQLINKPLHHHGARGESKRTRQLQIYAVLTGFLSMLTSLAMLVLNIFK